MSKGMTPDFNNTHRTPERLSTFRQQAHDGLDDILNKVAAGNASGGEAIILSPDPKLSNIRFRVTFCDFTKQTRCVHCQGTGLARNLTNDN